MVYTVVTERQYIPCTKNGDCNFLVLESNDEHNESKYIYVLIDQIASIELNSCNRFPLIHLFVNGRPNVICLQEDQRETLFNVINSYMDDSDDESESDESESNYAANTKNKKR